MIFHCDNYFLYRGPETAGMTSTWGRTPQFGAQTPAYGSMTPSYGSMTPLPGGGGRTPMYGSQTPMQGDGKSFTHIHTCIHVHVLYCTFTYMYVNNKSPYSTVITQ